MKGLSPKNNFFKNYYFILPIFLFVIFLIFFIFNILLKIWIADNQIVSSNILSTSSEYPIIKTQFIPQISAKGAIIMDARSKIVLYSKNPNLRFSPASTTKLMTALASVDFFKPEDILVVKTATREGSILGLVQNEQMTFRNLLYAMLLPSANDAALTISQNYPGGENVFLEKMNNEAKNLDLLNTHYGDPAGLLDREDYTTPFDLARLASFVMEKPILEKVVGTKEIVITDTSGVFVYDINNLNELLGTDGINGVKTGFTEEAGEVLVTSKNYKGKNIIIIVMGSEDRFLDTQKLLDLVDNNLSYLSIHP